MSKPPKFLPSALPLIQAPMAGIQASAMAAAVSNVGALGSIPAAMLGNDALAAELGKLKALTDKPWNVNFFSHTTPPADAARETAWRAALAPYYAEFGLSEADIAPGMGRAPFSDAVADIVEPFRPAVVSFHFGLPSADLLARAKSWGSLILASATTVSEAEWLQAHGVDAIIAQGSEAGGHRGMFLSDDLSTQIGTMALLPQIVAAVNLPVIAAGGIATPQGVRAAMQLGASAVQIGTAYMLADEALTSPLHRAALQSPAARHTALTNLFTGRPARGIVNRLMAEIGPMGPAPAFPTATTAIAPLRAKAEAQGSGDFSPLWSGQYNSGLRALPSADITRWLAEGL